MLGCVSVSRAQMPTPVLVVNVSDDLVRRGLSLTRFGVAEMGDQYTVGGTFQGRGGKVPRQIVVNLTTSSGKKVSRPTPLQAAPLGNYAFLVFLPMDEGTIKFVSISSR